MIVRGAPVFRLGLLLVAIAVASLVLRLIGFVLVVAELICPGF